jgi:tetratricopeptide (TPR) repeat protein
MDFCNASITKNYKQPVALNNRGSIEYNQMNFQDALKDYDEALAINKEYVLCYINRGGTRFMLKDYAGAVNDFSEAIKRNKNPYTEFYFRGLSYASINRFDLAIKDLNHYILLNPNEVLGYYHKGRMLSYIGKQDEAIEVFNQVIKINPYFSEAFSERALAKLRKGDPSGAITDCYSALQIKPNNESANKIISDAQNMINSKSSKK